MEIVRIFAMKRKKGMIMDGNNLFRTLIFVWGFVNLFIFILFKLDVVQKEDLFPTIILLVTCALMMKYGSGKDEIKEDKDACS